MTITVFSIPILGPIKLNLLFRGERELRLPEASDHMKRIWERPCEHSSMLFRYVDIFSWQFIILLSPSLFLMVMNSFISSLFSWDDDLELYVGLRWSRSACPNYNFRVLTLTVPQSTTHHSIIINTKLINLFYYFRKNVNIFFFFFFNKNSLYCSIHEFSISMGVL